MPVMTKTKPFDAPPRGAGGSPAPVAQEAPIWRPSQRRIDEANVTRLIELIRARHDGTVADYRSLHEFSIGSQHEFWSTLWDFFGIVGSKGGAALVNEESMLDARFFPRAELNYAENLLRRRDAATAIVGLAEDGSRRTVSWQDLYDQVARAKQALESLGVAPGDRVAACLTNIPEATVAFLATAALGAIWSSCSPEIGDSSLLDRYSQIEPKVLIGVGSYRYGGRSFDVSAKLKFLSDSLPSVEHTIVIGEQTGLPDIRVVTWDRLMAGSGPSSLVKFQAFPFDQPLLILFTSGTTGKPKAIVHRAGGVLMQGLKDMVLQGDLHARDSVFWPTTTGWVVWNTMLASLAWGSPVILYDGSITYPELDHVFRIIAQERPAVVRLVPPLIDRYLKAQLAPADKFDLTCIKTMTSGSAPLLPAHYRYVYSKINRDVHLSSPAGGTDICGTFVSGNPIGPVYAGEIQAPALGMAVKIFDNAGSPVVGVPGELVCVKPFPTLPIGFWGDKDGIRYRQTYFDKYPNVWRHGDWAETNERGGFRMHGRSDATLKIQGVRIGTAEIYRAIETVGEVEEAVAVAGKTEDEDSILLFVRLRPGATLDGDLKDRISSGIRRHASSRHVPRHIFKVEDLPRSLNGKPSEIAVQKTINGETLSNLSGLANPGALDEFRKISAGLSRAGTTGPQG